MSPYATLTIIPLAAMVVAVAIHRYMAAGTRVVNAPDKLFDDLCQKHAVDAAGQRLLWRMAVAVELSHPNVLFISPRQFDAAATTLASQRRGQQEDLLTLRQRLFETALEDEATAATSSSCPSLQSLPS